MSILKGQSPQLLRLTTASFVAKRTPRRLKNTSGVGSFAAGSADALGPEDGPKTPPPNIP